MSLGTDELGHDGRHLIGWVRGFSSSQHTSTADSVAARVAIKIGAALSSI